MKNLLTAREALEYLGVGKTQLIELIKNEKLPFVRISGYTRFRIQHLDKWIAERTSTVDDFPGVIDEIDKEIESSEIQAPARKKSTEPTVESPPELSVSKHFGIEEIRDDLCLTVFDNDRPEPVADEIKEVLGDIGIISKADGFIKEAIAAPGKPVRIGNVVHTFIDDINICVSEDKLKAYLYISPGATSANPASVLKALAETGIRHGLASTLIRAAGDKNIRGRLLVAACGSVPEPGGEARLTINFDTPRSFHPKSLESPDIDYSEFENISKVRKDQILAELIMPENARDGMNVYGETIKYKTGAQSLLRGGANTYFSEDKLRLHAAQEGVAYWKKNTICVDATQYLPEVGYDTGNIDFEGRVIIHENVRPGFSLTAGRKIIVKGHIEAAKVVSHISSIEIRGGIRGNRKALLVSKRNISAAFAERCHLHSGMNIVVESSIVGSEVYAAKSVKLTGENNRVVSSNITAGQSISVFAAGSPNHNKTVLKIQQPADDGSLSERLYLEKLIAELDNEIALTKQRIKRRAEQKSIAKKTEEKKLAALRKQIKQQEKALASFLQWTSDDERIFIDVAGIAHPGVEICIEDAAVEIRDPIENKRFYYYNGKIAVKDIPG